MIQVGSSGPVVKAFCVGQAKAGTASVCGLLATQYRARHEPEREQILDLILRKSRGDIDDGAVSDYLISRDQRLNLEYDIAWANQFIVGHLSTVFPNAKFIVLVRDPYTWLQSIVGHLISRQIPPDVRSFLDWWFKPESHPHTQHDRVLGNHGVYSIEAFLNAWNQHIDSSTRILPRARRLVLRTHELNQSNSSIAEFLEIPLDSLDTQRGHLNRSTWSGQLESLVDRTYVDETVHRVCGDNLARHFPEVSGIEDVSKLWGDAPSARLKGR
jgi:hypothetical protein